MDYLVSIIVPCYNQAQYLSEAISSVINQTYTNWECIIVNDGSPDNTKEVSSEWLSKDKRIKYIEIDNKGVSFARNIGIELALGKFILPLDADDRISTDYVALALKEFKENKNLRVVYGKAEKFGDINGIWNLKEFSLLNLTLSNMIYCSAIYKKKDWKRVGGYDINMVHGLEDWEFWIALLKNGGEVKQLDKVLFYYRIKDISRNNTFDKEQEKEILEYLSIKHVDFFVKQLGSFQYLENKTISLTNKHNKQVKSKKGIVNLFCNSFLGFKVFEE